jgi:hypothetical protein
MATWQTYWRPYYIVAILLAVILFQPSKATAQCASGSCSTGAGGLFSGAGLFRGRLLGGCSGKGLFGIRGRMEARQQSRQDARSACAGVTTQRVSVDNTGNTYVKTVVPVGVPVQTVLGASLTRLPSAIATVQPDDTAAVLADLTRQLADLNRRIAELERRTATP